MRISDWSSDVCSSDLISSITRTDGAFSIALSNTCATFLLVSWMYGLATLDASIWKLGHPRKSTSRSTAKVLPVPGGPYRITADGNSIPSRSEEHTSELQSLMRISYTVFCLKKKN